MTRHVLDRPRATAPSRTRVYLDPERREGPHPATRALIRRDRTESGRRVERFVTIARQQPPAD